MKLRLLILLAAALAAAPAAGQTIKSLGFNTTNGQVVYSGTNRLTFTNSLLVASQTGSVLSVGTTNVEIRRDPGSGSLIFTANGNTNTFEFLPSGTLRLSGPLSFDATTNALGYAATTRTNLGGTTVGNALFTAATTNAARVALGATVVGENIFTVPLQYQELFLRINADNTVSSLSPAATRTNLGLGATNNVTFSNVTASGTLGVTGNVTLSGVNNTATAQTADSASSLMTRSLSDVRYLGEMWNASKMAAYATTNPSVTVFMSEPMVTYTNLQPQGPYMQEFIPAEKYAGKRVKLLAYCRVNSTNGGNVQGAGRISYLTNTAGGADPNFPLSVGGQAHGTIGVFTSVSTDVFPVATSTNQYLIFTSNVGTISNNATMIVASFGFNRASTNTTFTNGNLYMHAVQLVVENP